MNPIQHMVADMTEDPTDAYTNEDGMKVILMAQHHHQQAQDALDQLINSGKGIRIGDDGPALEPGTDKYKGFITGLRIARHIYGDFPIKFNGEQQ